MPNVDEHGLEVLKKAAVNIGATPKTDYALQTIIKNTDPIAVSAAALPLPIGASTEATLADVLTRVTRLDVNLSSLLAPADTLAGVTNLSRLNNQIISMNTGVRDAGTQRVTIATNDLVPVSGSRSTNTAAPGANNVGAITTLANDAPPALTEGNLVLLSTDLTGNLRMVAKPFSARGNYEVAVDTGTFSGLGSGAPLVSFRWSDATRLLVLLRVEVSAFTTVPATTAGITELQLIIARLFTANDTGGSVISLGSGGKRRTSQSSALLSSLRAGVLSAGNRTLDAYPVASATGWSGLLSTGKVIGASGSSPVAAARSTEGGAQGVMLLDCVNGQDLPIILAQNEGVILQLGRAQPPGSTQIVFCKLTWAEVTAF